jgi:hypothetical protein
MGDKNGRCESCRNCSGRGRCSGAVSQKDSRPSAIATVRALHPGWENTSFLANDSQRFRVYCRQVERITPGRDICWFVAVVHFDFLNEGSLVNRKTSLARLLLLALFVAAISLVALAQTAPTKPLTIESIDQTGGLTGRGRENTTSSPDGTKLSFVQRDGEKGALWYADTARGEKKVLVSAEKLASLSSDVNNVKNERAIMSRPTPGHRMPSTCFSICKGSSGSTISVPKLRCSLPRPILAAIPSSRLTAATSAYTRKHNLYVRPVSGTGEKYLTKDADKLHGAILLVHGTSDDNVHFQNGIQ